MVLRHLERRDGHAGAPDNALDVRDLRVVERRRVERGPRRRAQNHVVESGLVGKREIAFGVRAQYAQPGLPLAVLAILGRSSRSGGNSAQKRAS